MVDASKVWIHMITVFMIIVIIIIIIIIIIITIIIIMVSMWFSSALSSASWVFHFTSQLLPACRGSTPLY